MRMLNEIVEEMRSRSVMKSDDAFYGVEEWKDLCDELERAYGAMFTSLSATIAGLRNELVECRERALETKRTLDAVMKRVNEFCTEG